MTENKVKHKLLEELVNEKKSHVSTISQRLNLDISLSFQYYEDMYYEDLINFIDASSQDGIDAIIEIKGKGRVFYENGGYIKKGRAESIKENVSNLKTYTTILAAIMTIISVFFGIKSFNYKAQVDKLEFVNDSLISDNYVLKSKIATLTTKRIIKQDSNETNGNEVEDFTHFIYKFCSDIEFQKDRIKFPIQATFFTDFNQEPLDTIFNRGDWNHEYLIMKEEYVIQTYDNHQGELKNTNERLISYEGIENGISINYFFERIDNLWYLIKFNDLSN